MVVGTTYKDLDSHGTEMDEESFPLEDLSVQGLPTYPDPLKKSDEEWLMLERSNFFKRFFIKLWKGPREPSDQRPVYPSKLRVLQFIDEFPDGVFRYYISNPFFRALIFIVYCSIWFGFMYELLEPYLVKPPYFYPKASNDDVPITSLTCNMMLNWEGINNACGTNADLCEPFDHKEYIIRCPALCDVNGWLYSAVAVGDQRNKYRGYQIGGGSKGKGDNGGFLSLPYRADSFQCSAAVHAGVISPIWGGCAKISMQGSQSNFPSANGKYKTGPSIGFDTFFPASFSFKDFKDGIATGCYDPRVPVVVLNFFFGLPILYLTRGVVGYWITTLVSYWTVVLALDPPLLTDPHEPFSVAELLSVGFQRLLPLCFVLYVLWKCAVKRTFDNGSPLTKILLWYPTFWSGVMNNITYDRLPVDRLTFRDMKQQAGAATAVGSILATIVVGAIIQGYSLWKSGRLRKYMLLYLLILLSLFFLQSIPGLNLRLHHYILGILFVPGCATRGSSAYLFQGILIGLFISGVSRWDFASIVETDLHLLRDEAGASFEPPAFQFDPERPHSISWKLDTKTNSTIAAKNDDEKIDGYSLLMNDFQIYVGENTTVDIDQLLNQNYNVSHMLNQTMNQTDKDTKLYFRVARASTKNPINYRGDYTNAGVLEWPNGRWHDPAPGVS
ncbi:hypothetical protein ZYGR_0I03580 [Zygosaccharomyces rouxii]|uniref:ZYRO0C08536p n=2 Tax=Zygosaccharomyces rouxii TaxID=4956 RepID=C5DTH3_ZYGRC|nr:uncharacterized protein ZYRO0C08536g [Zygosaccharomyces rouxii]KAH9201737.1 hypothetical protein LQ764DRAFT_233447 [Zygosaccharomyces rouxii]GAV48061.1 hypothetical protein ZYGR_0I03580 [Zygosaccharomyces rouxii]CAR27084.1 ZYRO0C08536p [Zygosaccharomyces rouxii]